MKLPFFSLLLLFAAGLIAQSSVDFGRTDDDKLNDRLVIDGTALTEYIYADIPEVYKEQMTERTALRFADQMARGAVSLLSEGNVYNGWTEMDNYVNSILDRITPKELRNKDYVRAYVLKDGNPNAFMTPSGLFFINIGMLAEVETESSLAGIIAHELAHYQLRHGLDRYVKSEQGEFDGGLLFNSRKAASAFSIDNELASDALAAEYMQAAGYDVQGLADAFAVFKRQEDRRLLQLQDVWEIKETTHPNSSSRIERIEEFISEQEGSNVAGDLASREQNFSKLRKEAKAEVLKYLMAGFAYNTCLEKAFSYHLFEPQNPTYVYYAMEAIRRSCYLDATLWNKKFLADKYFDIEEKRGVRRKVEIPNHFFDRFRPTILSLDSTDYADIAAKFYWEEEVKFITNEQAFQFFYQVGKLLEEPECTLSNALSLSFDPALQNKYLQEYLAYGNVQHQEFAEALLNGKIYEALPAKALTVFHELMPVMKHGVDDIAVWHRGDEAPLREAMRKTVTAFPDRDFLYLPDLRKTKINDYLVLNSLESFSFQVLYARGEKTELHILDPHYWEVMKRYGASRIEFINCIYNDKAKGNYTAEVYKEVIESSFDDILRKPEEKGRYVKMYVSGLQISEEGPMKLRAYDGSDKLAVKGDGYTLLGELLHEKLAELDKSLED